MKNNTDFIRAIIRFHAQYRRNLDEVRVSQDSPPPPPPDVAILHPTGNFKINRLLIEITFEDEATAPETPH